VTLLPHNQYYTSGSFVTEPFTAPFRCLRLSRINLNLVVTNHRPLGKGVKMKRTIHHACVKERNALMPSFVYHTSSYQKTQKYGHQRNNHAHPRPPPPLLCPLQTVQTRAPRTRHLLINNVCCPLLPPPPSLRGEHEDGVERPCVHWQAATVCEVYI